MLSRRQFLCGAASTLVLAAAAKPHEPLVGEFSEWRGITFTESTPVTAANLREASRMLDQRAIPTENRYAWIVLNPSTGGLT